MRQYGIDVLMCKRFVIETDRPPKPRREIRRKLAALGAEASVARCRSESNDNSKRAQATQLFEKIRTDGE